MSLYSYQYQEYPVPYPWKWISSCEQADKITSTELQSLVLSVDRTEKRWSSVKPLAVPQALRIPEISSNSVSQLSNNIGMLLSLDILLDRWLVAVYQEAVVTLWDLHPSWDSDNGLGFQWHDTYSKRSSPRCKVRHDLHGIGLCTSSTLAMTKERDAILLAVSRYALSQCV